MARRPYHIARQEHLGDMLDELQECGRLEWQWAYDSIRSRAIFNVKLARGEWASLNTRMAEELVQKQCDDAGIRWRPVPHPGGETQRAAVLTWMEDRARGA